MQILFKKGDATIYADASGGFNAVLPDMWGGRVVGMAFKQQNGLYNVHDIAKGGHPTQYRSRGGAIRALLRLAGQEA